MKAKTSISKMSVPHLLLNKHFLYRYTRVVNSSNLARNWTSLLVTTGKWANASRSIMNIILFTNSSPGPTCLAVLTGLILATLVPHEICQRVPLDELVGSNVLRLIRAEHVSNTTGGTTRHFFQSFDLAGYCRSGDACNIGISCPIMLQ